MQDVRTTPQPLLPRVARGEADAFDACIQRYSPLIWTLAKKFLRDAAGLEDLVQEIFIDVWRSAARFDALKASESTWIAIIARRRVIDRLRRESRERELALVEAANVSSVDKGYSHIDTGDDAQRAHELLAVLPPEQRRVILMSVVDGLTHQEIATHTGIPLGTVKSHIRRGLEQTAQALRTRTLEGRA
jgi:RNA polymerase sigma-70 factor (ECF subfamily)